ncbi:MAG: 16S rRNA (guanine(527)-N(7))-methyltransferase RsmG [Christensenellales bacterium]|jgi:16S rRNA (guanine527-N7)-methyltransferase
MRKMIIERAAAMGIDMSADQAAKFEQFHEMLVLANARMNLTRVPDDRDEAIDRNYLDSIAPLAHGLPAGARSLIDIGAGAGFPGIPLAIMRPDIEITLLDSLGKRVAFMREAIQTLGLNARAEHLRAEDAGRKPGMREGYDIAVARAVARIRVLAELALPLVRVGGAMIAYKGPAWTEELEEAQNAIRILGGRFERAAPAPIPGRDWAHTLIDIKKQSPTPHAYPRRAGIPEKKPI